MSSYASFHMPDSYYIRPDPPPCRCENDCQCQCDHGETISVYDEAPETTDGIAGTAPDGCRITCRCADACQCVDDEDWQYDMAMRNGGY